MKKFIEDKYYHTTLFYIGFLSIYVMSGIVVPLQFIVANKYITIAFFGIGVVLGTYNLLFKKILTCLENIVLLGAFFIFNIVTSLLVFNYGYIENIKNAVVMYIYFFTIYPSMLFFSKDQKIIIGKIFLTIISLIQTISVIISIIQFLMIKGYMTTSYRGEEIEQGFMASRLFGIFLDPNYLSALSLFVIIYLVTLALATEHKLAKTLYYMTSLVNYIYIILSGSRMTLICLNIAIIVYMLVLYKNQNYFKKISKMLVVLVVMFIGYYGIKKAGNIYLDYSMNAKTQNIVQSKQETSSETQQISQDNETTQTKTEVVKSSQEKEAPLTLNRQDTSSNNISNNRFTIWENVVKLIVHRPILGYSSGNWYDVASDYSKDNYVVQQRYYTHNGYLEILFYNGIIGLLLILLFVFKLGFGLMKQSKLSKNHSVSAMLLTMLSVWASLNVFLSITLYGINIFACILFLIASYYFSERKKLNTEY